MSWKDYFTPARPGLEMKPLGLTLPKPHQGEPGWASFPAGFYPACSKHGAMNKVSADAQMWRCLNCNIGVEVVPAHAWQGVPAGVLSDLAREAGA